MSTVYWTPWHAQQWALATSNGNHPPVVHFIGERPWSSLQPPAEPVVVDESGDAVAPDED